MDHVPPEDARPTLADLVHINRNFGGHAALRRSLARVANPREPFTLLDVGAASGDTARLIRHGYPLASITNLDYNRVNLNQAPHPKLIADAFELPFLPQSFDYVLCSLFIHHFSDEQIRVLLRAFYAVARRALIVCDLERHIVPYWFLPLASVFFGWRRLTVHDGMISIRASFRRDELAQLITSAGIQGAELQLHRPAFRISAIARKGTTS
jgi:ubiquinone/menaquinone biosynthesis C-methylase UbiE